MDYIRIFGVLGIVILLYLYILIKKLFVLTKNKHKIIPPSPPCIPIIGHLHQFTKTALVHRTFQQLSTQYGFLFSLKLGSLPFVIISSPAAVKECFTKNDVVLANRPRALAGKHLHYDWTTLAVAPYGPLWLKLRRLSNLELFSNTQINTFATIRAEEVRALVKGLFVKSKVNYFTKFEMSSMFSGLSFNILTRMLFGKKYISEGFGDDKNHEFFGIMREVFELNGIPNMGDIKSLLGWFLYGEKRMVATRRKMDNFFDHLIGECRGNKDGSDSTMIYKLLNLQESDPQNYSDDIIKGIIMVMLAAGTDTSSATIEWALSLLLNNPNVFEKARQEVESYKTNVELVQESDLPQLAYIQCIINETLRLFPPAPLLIAHVPSEDITISGYHIDKGSMCMINAWAIHRDPNVWDDPLTFRPERFQGLKNEDYKFSLIPFGLGRRSCPGASLANRIIGLSLATLIQCFDWETVDGNEVDLREGIGLTMPKAKPLEAMCRVRKRLVNVLSRT